MTSPEDSQPASACGESRFTTTHWSVVLKAREEGSPDALEALENLCSTYWYPLYAYVRRIGHNHHDAQDLTQAFFARFLEKKYLGQVHRERGKFRSFLLASLKHFLADKWDKEQAKKRGGAQTFVPLDADSAETRYLQEAVDDATPDKLYDKQWALQVLGQARERLRQEYVQVRKAELFERLKIFEAGDRGDPTYAEVGAQLGMTESAVKSEAYRMRQRYHELIREEIAHTVSSPDDIDDEIRYLLTLIAG